MSGVTLNTAWISSGLMIPTVEVTTISPTTTTTRSRYGRNSGMTRRHVSRSARTAGPSVT